MVPQGSGKTCARGCWKGLVQLHLSSASSSQSRLAGITYYHLTTSPHTPTSTHTHTHSLSLFSTLPRTHRRPRRPTIPIPIPTVPVTSTTKPKTPNPPRQRIPHRIHRPLRTPQTNLPLPVRNIEKFDTRPRPETIAAAVVLSV